MERIIPIIDGTRENTKDYGLFIGTDVPNGGLSIPFYKGSVIEGHNLPFECHGKAVIRTAQIHKRDPHVKWLERHMRMTQLFVGLGSSPLVMILGKPTHEQGKDLPNLDDVIGFRFPPGHGIMIHRGTWHDFPMAYAEPVTVLTANSEEVVIALAEAKSADELDAGDVYKIDIEKRMQTRLIADIP